MATTIPWYLGVPGVPDPAPVNAMQGATVPDEPFTMNLPLNIPPQAGMDAYQMGGMTPGQPENLLPANFMQQSQPAPQRQRRSFLDTVGSIADVLAKVGGAQALYQPSLDARADRSMALEDRQRGIDMDALRKSILEGQYHQSQILDPLAVQEAKQKISAGDVALQDSLHGRIGDVLGPLAGHPDAATLWPQLAEQEGIPADQAAKIGALIQQNPNMAGPIAQSFGYKPIVPPSEAANVQTYKLLLSQNPDLAKTYLKSIADPNALTPKEQAALDQQMRQFGLEQQKFRFEQYKFEHPQEKPATPAAAAKAQADRDTQTQAAQSVLDTLGNLQKRFNNLESGGGLPGQGGNIISQAAGALGRTGVGQAVGVTFGNQNAQERRAAEKEIATLQTDMMKGIPASALRSKFELEQLLKRIPDPYTLDAAHAKSVIDDIRTKYQTILKNAQAEVAARPAAAPAPRGPGGKPASSNQPKIVDFNSLRK